MKTITESMQIGDKTLSFQIGKLAQAADVSILGRMGDTCVLVTVVVGPEADLGYFPLSIEYVEKLYAGGRIKGSRWVKREGRPSEEAILIGRLIDRSIRPLFPKTYKKQVQVVATLLSVDGENSPDIVASMTVEAAIHMSQVPWNGPISTMRVGYVKMNGDETGSLMVNPDEEDQKFSTLDLVVSSSKEKVLMIETKAEILPDQIIIDGIKLAKAENAKVVEFMQMMRDKYGKEKETFKVDEKIAQIMKIVEKDYHAQIEEYLSHRGDSERNSCSELDGIAAEILEKNPEEYTAKQISAAIEKYTYKVTKDNVIDKAKRVDGRGIDQVRDLYIESSVLPRTHGSAIFQRGQTQVLSIATLGAPTLGQIIEGPEGEVAKNYIHHYYMPPYSVGECGRMGTPSRREIGHGALAEKAIEPVLPSATDFPYAIRVVSEVMSSNGSTSMASTCGSSLALMDAGVPIKSAVAGISVGLFSRSDEEYVLLTDIVGFEDFSGEMDFKIAGTDTGITAIQLDVKNLGLTDKMIDETFVKARTARFAILEQMNAVISKPRKEMSQYAPKVVLLTPPADKIGEIIGPGGKNIKQIISKTQTDINITDDGKVTISGVDKDMVEKAISLIENVYRVVEIGETHEGEVKRILQFGAFVEFLPGKEGLVHVSKMGKGFVKDAHDVFSVGEKILVKVSQIDSQGRINLEPANKPVDVVQGE